MDCHLLHYKGPAVIGETSSSVPLPTGKKLNKQKNKKNIIANTSISVSVVSDITADTLLLLAFNGCLFTIVKSSPRVV